MKSHDQLVKKLLRRPGVRAEVERIERALATDEHLPSLATLRKYVRARSKSPVSRVA